MSLFMLEPPETKTALFSFANSHFKPGTLFHVHGKTSAGCSVLYNGNGYFDVFSDFCNSRYYFYCQYTREPKANVPGEVTTCQTEVNLTSKNVLGPLNTNICFFKADFYTTNNKYVQSACLLIPGKTYRRAEMNCQANGMDLLDIHYNEFELTMIDHAAEIFSEYGGVILNVKGRDDGQCQYIDNTYGPFKAYYGSCLDEFFSLCGFKKEMVVLANGEGEFLIFLPFL